MDILQGRTWRVIVDGIGDGLTHEDVVCRIMREGDEDFLPKPLTALTWVESGIIPGFYTLLLEPADTRNVGALVVHLSGSFGTRLIDLSVMPNPIASIEPGKCIVSGNIVNIGGYPDQTTTVRFRLQRFPAAFSSAFVGGDSLETRPDARGNFSVSLLQGATILVDMAGAGIKHQITIPTQETASLIDLLPPLP